MVKVEPAKSLRMFKRLSQEERKIVFQIANFKLKLAFLVKSNAMDRRQGALGIKREANFCRS